MDARRRRRSEGAEASGSSATSGSFKAGAYPQFYATGSKTVRAAGPRVSVEHERSAMSLLANSSQQFPLWP
jgi:hypothetical protein